MDLISKRFGNVSSLQLQKMKEITDDELPSLLQLPHLTSLDLTSNHFREVRKITYRGVHHLQSLQNLRALNLTGCQNVGDGWVQELQLLTNLTRLSLKSCFMMTGKNASFLVALTALQDLDLGYCSCYQTDALGAGCILGISHKT